MPERDPESCPNCKAIPQRPPCLVCGGPGRRPDPDCGFCDGKGGDYEYGEWVPCGCRRRPDTKEAPDA